MKSVLCFSALILSIMPGDSLAGYFQSSTTWISRCEQPIIDTDKQNAEYVKATASLSPCYAYLMAIADALDASLIEAKKSVKTDKLSYWRAEVCIPHSADQESLRLAFLEYTKKYPYPQLTGTSPAYVVADSFATKWPCAD
ncbi:hypothetical protein GCM10008940_29480 [Microbulbifer agarilyticus]